MGTETLLWSKLYTDFIKSTVKLNDPQWGQKSTILLFVDSAFSYFI